ncbi:MAG: hypothetical protein O7E57_13300 [Gammaproteobacteria bacterium]|nr:hypothetical protein [Gammaproteobacteria bacterium]
MTQVDRLVLSTLTLSALTLSALTLFGWSSADGAVYRCGHKPGVVLFSQFPCTDAELVSEHPVSVIVMPALDESQRLMLSHIERNSSSLERARQKRAKQRHRQREKHRTNRSALCGQALRGIADIRAVKRAGYSLSESAALDKREAGLRQQQAQNC